MKFVDLTRELRDAGYTEVRCRGSHHTFAHPELGRITVPHHRGGHDLASGTVHAIRDQIKRTKRGLASHQIRR